MMKYFSKYAPLMAFQLVLMVMYHIFVKFPIPTEEDVPIVHNIKNMWLDPWKTKKCDGFSDTHVMIFIGFGYLMTFLRKYCYSALGFNWLLGAIVIQWALLCQNFFHHTVAPGFINITKEHLLEADIMAATVLITFGALLGVASDLQLFFIAIVETVVASANIYLVSHYFMAADIGGSIAIHTFGAYFGLGVSLALRNKKNDPDSTPESESLAGPSYISDVTAMLGSIFLWVYWPSFNSGLADNEFECHRAIANTYLALAAATVTTFFLSSSLSNEGKLDMVHIQNSTLAGGVAVGAVCNMFIGGGGAITIGIGAGFISVLGYKYLTPLLERIGILDTCGVHNLHGLPGVFSGLLSVLFAFLASSDDYGKELSTVFPAMKNNGRSASTQALNQFFALAATLGIALGSGIITGFVSKISTFKPLQPKQRYDDQQYWELP